MFPPVFKTFLEHTLWSNLAPAKQFLLCLQQLQNALPWLFLVLRRGKVTCVTFHSIDLSICIDFSIVGKVTQVTLVNTMVAVYYGVIFYKAIMYILVHYHDAISINHPIWEFFYRYLYGSNKLQKQYKLCWPYQLVIKFVNQLQLTIFIFLSQY